MTTFDPPRPVIEAVVAQALAEDLGVLGDITSTACIGEDQTAVAAFGARAEGVFAGTALATEVYRQLDGNVSVKWSVRDGESIEAGMELGRVSGSLRSLLAGERVALNFLTHSSGVASLTRRYVRAAHAARRAFAIPARRCRDCARCRRRRCAPAADSTTATRSPTRCSSRTITSRCSDFAQSVERARARWPGRIIEVECDSLEQVTDACKVGVDLVLLDNMTPEEVVRAVGLCNGAVKVEVSGGVTLDTVGAYAETGADFISVGAITHSVRGLDIGLDIL